MPLLDIQHLRIEFVHGRKRLVAIDDVSLAIDPEEVLGVVGESGAGKSLTAMSVIGLLNPPAKLTRGQITIDGRRSDNLTDRQLRRIRGKIVGAVFQESLTSLNPLYTIGRQLVQTIRVHSDLTATAARGRAIDLLAEFGLSTPERQLDAYPHQLSGGMRQRVVIAMAVCANPRLLIADEPTTALDVSTQAQIIAVLQRLRRDYRTAIMLITHDMGVIAEIADRVAVMYAGRIVEVAPVRDVVAHPQHPYTAALIGAIPRLRRPVGRLTRINGAMPPLSALPRGCAFHPRCPKAFTRCREERPPMLSSGSGRAACWLFDGNG